MNSYSRELESFEKFCRTELQTLFARTEQSMTGTLAAVDDIQKSYLKNVTPLQKAVVENAQFKSIEYSFFSGGKRFRPLLTFAAADYLEIEIESVFGWSMALEMIHTYSLIHDDLPSMDNDDVRRGKPTNHKVYGEALALLSGDALLTEAFGLLAKYYNPPRANLSALINSLARISGLNGMILGQYYDISLDASIATNLYSISHLNHIHILKTGALISGSFMGPAHLKGLKTSDLRSFEEIGVLLGYAFQVKDDILDSAQDKGSQKNLSYFFKENTELTLFLNQIHQEIGKKIAIFSSQRGLADDKTSRLTQFLEWNSEREK